MKTKLIGLLLLAVLLTSGCGALDRAYVKKDIPASTNAVTGVITPARVELTDNPVVATTIGVAGALPIPWAGTIAAILGGLYAVYRNARNKKALDAVITGVEAFRRTLQTPELAAQDAKLKSFLIEHQEIGGVIDIVGKAVNDLTVDTTTR